MSNQSNSPNLSSEPTSGWIEIETSENINSFDCEEADRLLQAQEYEGAIAPYKRAIASASVSPGERNPHLAMAYYGLTRAHYSLKDFQAALVACGVNRATIMSGVRSRESGVGNREW